MTIEIRQMVIKSSVGASAAEKAPAKGAVKAKATEDDCDCGDDCAGGAGQQERQKMRSAISAEWERMRER